MPDPVPAMSSKESAELAAYRERDAYEKRIAEIVAERSAICNGAIPAAMLRDIAISQIAHDKKLAAESSAKK